MLLGIKVQHKVEGIYSSVLQIKNLRTTNLFNQIQLLDIRIFSGTRSESLWGGKGRDRLLCTLVIVQTRKAKKEYRTVNQICTSNINNHHNWIICKQEIIPLHNYSNIRWKIAASALSIGESNLNTIIDLKVHNLNKLKWKLWPIQIIAKGVAHLQCEIKSGLFPSQLTLLFKSATNLGKFAF